MFFNTKTQQLLLGPDQIEKSETVTKVKRLEMGNMLITMEYHDGRLSLIVLRNRAPNGSLGYGGLYLNANEFNSLKELIKNADI